MSFGAVAGAVVGGVLAADASGNAADAQKDAASQTNATNRAMSNKQLELQEPFRDTGYLANNRLAHMMGLRSEGESAAQSAAYDRIYGAERAKADAAHRAQYGFGFDDAPGWAQGSVSAWDDQIKANSKKWAAGEAQGAGGPAGEGYGSLMKKFGMEDFQADPGYQFRMDEGMRGVEGSAAARGDLLSGAAQKAIQKYGQGLASQEYGNAYSRFENDKSNNYNRLAGMVNSGQGAANQMSNTAGQFAQNNANALGAYGNAQAAGYMGQANAINNGIGQATNFYQGNELMNLIRNPGANSGSWRTTGWGSGGSGSGYAFGNRDLGENF